MGWEVDWRAEPVFNIDITVPRFPHRGLTFVDVSMALFKFGHHADLMESLGFGETEEEWPPGSLSYAMSWAEHCFTETEADQVREHLALCRQDLPIYVEPARLPAPVYMAPSDLPGSYQHVYLFCRAEGYDLAFDLAGVYDLRHHEALGQEAKGRVAAQRVLNVGAQAYCRNCETRLEPLESHSFLEGSNDLLCEVCAYERGTGSQR